MLKDMEDEIANARKYIWGVNKIKDNNVATEFYTELPSFAVFLWLFR